MSQKTDQLFAHLVKLDQSFMPHLAQEIDNGHPTANTKDRLRDFHTIVSTLLRYTILSNAEKHGVTLGQAAALSSHDNQSPALLAAQHYPATGQVSLGAPPMSRQVVTTVIDGSQPLPGINNPAINVLAGGVSTSEVDPEPADVVQIITRKDGSTKVIPPRGYDIAPRVFGAGQPVDATFYLPPVAPMAPGA
jgi:hypothetical protein